MLIRTSSIGMYRQVPLCFSVLSFLRWQKCSWVYGQPVMLQEILSELLPKTSEYIYLSVHDHVHAVVVLIGNAVV